MRRAIAAFGRTLVTLGLLILLFVAYQLWGTGIFTARAQDDLQADFKPQPIATHDDHDDHDDHADHVRRRPTDDDRHATDPPRRPRPKATGSGRSRSRRSAWTRSSCEGTGRDDLKKGPGHYPGHADAGPDRQRRDRRPPHHVRRTRSSTSTSSKPATRSSSTTLAGTLHLRTSPSKLIVHPSDTCVVANTPDAQLTLTTCNPKYSARERLVIKAKLVPDQDRRCRSKPPTLRGETPTTRGRRSPKGLDGESKPLGPAYGWGAIVAARRRRVVVGVPPLAPPGDVARRRRAVPHGAVRLLRTSSNASLPAGY